MSTQFYHRADHAVDTLARIYFYRRVEIQISAPGGLVQSIDHLALAVERWRAEGVQICTRVTTSAYSAAAVLFSIGDERVVESTARFLPVVAAMARAPHQEVGGALIIDPKRELAPTLSGLAGDRVQRPRSAAPRSSTSWTGPVGASPRTWLRDAG